MSVLQEGLGKIWWLILLRGLCSIVFGVLAFLWPGATLITLVLLYGAYAVADGVLALGAAARGGTVAPRWWLVLAGLAGIIVGALAFFWPKITGLVLLFLIAAWAISIGVVQIVGAIQLRKEIENEWWLIASGIVSVVFGGLLILAPSTGALALILVIGGFAVVYGVLQVGFALRLRRHAGGS